MRRMEARALEYRLIDRDDGKGRQFSSGKFRRKMIFAIEDSPSGWVRFIFA